MTHLNALEHLTNIDRLVHEPARYVILAHLYVVERADFVLLARQTNLSGGNLASHMRKLEDAAYVEVEKSFVGKRPRTVFRLTPKGRSAFQTYRTTMLEVLQIPGPQ